MPSDSATVPEPGAIPDDSPRRLHYMPLYTGDFMSETRGWPVTACGVYLLLQSAEWDTGGLPADERVLRRLIGATPREWRTWKSHVEVKFPIDVDGLRRNRRLEEHRQRALRLSVTRREIGSRGGKASAIARATLLPFRRSNP